MATTTHTSSKLRPPFVVAGLVTGIVALVLLAAGAGLLWADGRKDGDGYLVTDRETFSSRTPALVTENLDIDLGAGEWLVDSGDLGEVRLSVTSDAVKPIFVGVARASAVERYLDGVAHTTLTNLQYGPFEALDADERDARGARRADRPATESIWAASATGTGVQHLTWKVREGDWSIVVMNADGSAGVGAEVEAGAKLPVLDELAWTGIGGGAIFVILTGGLFLHAARPRRATPAG